MGQAFQSNSTLGMHDEIQMIVNIQGLPGGGAITKLPSFPSEISRLAKMKSIIDPTVHLKSPGYCLVAALLVGRHVSQKARKKLVDAPKVLRDACDKVFQMAGLVPGNLGIRELEVFSELPIFQSFGISLYDWQGNRTFYKDR